MVFGWGKKKDDKLVKSTREIPLSEILGILAAHKKSRQEKTAQDSKPRFNTIKKELHSILGIIEHLKNDDLNLDNVDNRIKVIAVRGKAEIVDIVIKEARTPIPEVDTYESMIKCTEVCSHILKKIGDVLGKNSRIIHIFAKKYANDLKTHLETVTANHDTILKMIQEMKNLEATEEAIREKKEQIESAYEEIAIKTTNLSKYKELLQHYSKSIVDTEQKIQLLKSSKEYSQFLNSQNLLQQLSDERNRVHKEIDDEFSKISRPLGKYVYVTSLDKPLKMLLESLIQSPSGTLDASNKDAVITILESCMKGVISGTVSVKENEKTVDQITHLISILDQLIGKKGNHEQKIKKVKEQAGSFNQDEFESLGKQLENSREDAQITESKIRNLESEIEQQTKQSKQLFDDLSTLLQKTLGVHYKVMQ